MEAPTAGWSRVVPPDIRAAEPRTWRDLPPHPPYGPVPPPRPDLGLPPAEAEPPVLTGGRSPARTALVVGIGVLTLAIGVGLGLWLSGDDEPEETAEVDETPPLDSMIPPPLSLPDLPRPDSAPEAPFGGEQPPASGQLEPVPQPSTPPTIAPDPFDGAGSTVPEGDLGDALSRIFDVADPPAGFEEAATTLRRTERGDDVTEEQTTILSDGMTEIAVRATLGADAPSRFTTVIADDSAEPVDLGDHDAWLVDGSRLVWQPREDLVLEIDAQGQLDAEGLTALAEGIEVRR